MRHGRGSILLNNPRGRVLEELAAKGPLTLPEIPLGWPLTRAMLRGMVEDLVDAGLVEAEPSGRIPGGAAYALTAKGRAGMAPAVATRGQALKAG